jgi:hypothetical protein
MRKLLLLSCTLALVVGLAASGAWADQVFPNNTEVQSWWSGKEYTSSFSQSTYVPGVTSGNWYDVIGDPGVFETYGAVLSGSQLTIHTNWPGQNFYDHFNGYSRDAVTADLFIRAGTGSSWTYAIALGNLNPLNSADNLGRMGTVYVNPDYNTSTYYFGTSGLIYGGLYNTGTIANPTGAVVPVFATSGTSSYQNANLVSWTSGDPVIDLSLLTGFNINGGWNFLWATGTCANDTALGSVESRGAPPVPLPGAMVLLGAGLVRLGAYGRKRRMAL